MLYLYTGRRFHRDQRHRQLDKENQVISYYTLSRSFCEVIKKAVISRYVIIVL